MTAVETWGAELQPLAPSEWPAYLTAHSGLPGPRANLQLLEAAATVADEAQIAALLEDGEEFPAMCAGAALGRLSADPASEARARTLAADDRWRVREGVAIGLQQLGDAAPAALTSVVTRWAGDPDPLVQRAAAAAICEPRLLRTPEAAAVAVEVCRRSTAHLVALPSERRRDSGVRTLRQALGYCWSVAVAADPGPGLVAFRALDTTDPDVAWIVKQNRSKKRLASLL
ncbi:HEAT repeat domain-containing protein [Sanguibacter sp. 25GB23B1]|uniref:HEAT repeat domain-containing protein n=1 Tax=unclassified Sanguibacter TaxID=2645534 RepID=UPI0032AEC077